MAHTQERQQKGQLTAYHLVSYQLYLTSNTQIFDC